MKDNTQKWVVRVLKWLYIKYLETIIWKFIRLLKNRNPIIVYQMGKVGSSTVATSLKKSILSCSVYQVHFLSEDRINEAETYFRSLHPTLYYIPKHLRLAKFVNKELRTRVNKSVKIISLVRDPVSRDISDFFNNVDRFYSHLLDDDGRVNIEAAMEFLSNQFNTYNPTTDYTCTWFDTEFYKALHINPYDYPFNHEKSFIIIREKKIEILILRLEDLNRSFNEAIKLFFIDEGMDIQMIKTNIGKEKKYAENYKYIQEKFKLPKIVLEKIYSTKYATHFYNENMRKQFISKWSKQ